MRWAFLHVCCEPVAGATALAAIGHCCTCLHRIPGLGDGRAFSNNREQGETRRAFVFVENLLRARYAPRWNCTLRLGTKKI